MLILVNHMMRNMRKRNKFKKKLDKGNSFIYNLSEIEIFIVTGS